MTSETTDDPARAEIRAYFRAHPELTLHEIVATVMRDQPPDDPHFSVVVSETWAAAERDVARFWELLEEQHPGVAEALTNSVLAPMVIEVAREERAPG